MLPQPHNCSHEIPRRITSYNVCYTKLLRRSLSAPNIIEHIPLGEDFAITEVSPPRKFIGKSLIELDMRNRYKVTVLGIRDVLTGEFIALRNNFV